MEGRRDETQRIVSCELSSLLYHELHYLRRQREANRPAPAVHSALR
jgi:hypothetical protein